jgi:hypothetical protein
VPAFGESVVVDELGVRFFRPAPWGRIEFVGEDAHGDRDADALRVEIPFAKILPSDGGPPTKRHNQALKNGCAVHVTGPFIPLVTLNEKLDSPP